jgi:cAMP phosphodiesterase
MKFRVLGCSGGIGGGRHTTAFLVDDDILIDAGSGVTRLGLEAMRAIDHVFVTHTHLDHVLAIPLLLDSVAGERAAPLQVHGMPEAIEVLKGHVFNWLIWPDFSQIPNSRQPFMKYARLHMGKPTRVGGREIIPIPANHGRPAIGFLVRGAGGSLLFSGDTCSHAALWEIANATPDLKHLIVEASFPNQLRELAELSSHYCPATLLPDLARLRSGIQVWITHLKPGQETQIMTELQAGAGAAARPQALLQDQVIEL